MISMQRSVETPVFSYESNFLEQSSTSECSINVTFALMFMLSIPWRHTGWWQKKGLQRQALFDFSLQLAWHFINTAQLIWALLSGLLAINIFTAYPSTKNKRDRKSFFNLFFFFFWNKEHSVNFLCLCLSICSWIVMNLCFLWNCYLHSDTSICAPPLRFALKNIIYVIFCKTLKF